MGPSDLVRAVRKRVRLGFLLILIGFYLSGLDGIMYAPERVGDELRRCGLITVGH